MLPRRLVQIRKIISSKKFLIDKSEKITFCIFFLFLSSYIQTMRYRNNNEYIPQSPSVMMNNSNLKTRSMEKLYSPRYDRHTEV